MAGVAETDIEVKFVLENVPPFKYVVAAGRLDLQTYYPGTQTFADATVVTIVPEAAVSGINFVLKDTSFVRAANSFGMVGSIQTSIPVKVIVENGGKLPISSGKFVSIRAESLSMRPVTIPIDVSSRNPRSGNSCIRRIPNCSWNKIDRACWTLQKPTLV